MNKCIDPTGWGVNWIAVMLGLMLWDGIKWLWRRSRR